MAFLHPCRGAMCLLKLTGGCAAVRLHHRLTSEVPPGLSFSSASFQDNPHISLLLALTASFTAKLIRDGALFPVGKTIVAAGGRSPRGFAQVRLKHTHGGCITAPESTRF